MRPDKSMWKGLIDRYRRGEMGPGVARAVPNALKEFFPGFTFCFVDEGNLPKYRSLGWVPITPGMFPEGNFNTEIGLQLGLHERDGAIWFRDVVVCLMPEDVHNGVSEAVAERTEKEYREQMQQPHGPGVPPDASARYEEGQTTAAELAAATKRSRGRRKRE